MGPACTSPANARSTASSASLSSLTSWPPTTVPRENYLIVGSDTRDVVDENAEDAGLFLDGTTGEGGRSDTIMILRRDPDNGASLLSIPRDLWVPIAGTGDDGKINWAYIGGPRRLAETITQALGIPIHHYVEVDFAGFQRLVDEIGGVEICVEDAAEDINSGLVLQPGCQTLDGRMALAFARSRHYRAWRDGEWHDEPGAPDLNRIARQQIFLRTAATEVLNEINSNPFRLGDLIDAAGGAVRLDDQVNLVEAGEAMIAAAQDGMQTFSIPVNGDDDRRPVGARARRWGGRGPRLLPRASGPIPAVPETTEPPA